MAEELREERREVESSAFWRAFATGETQEAQSAVRRLVGHTPAVTPETAFTFDEEEGTGGETAGDSVAPDTPRVTVAA